MKTRIIPSILTNGTTVIKGSKFDNWRTVGDVEALARLFAKRNVDELIFLDVEARKRGEHLSAELVGKFAEVLDVPFSIGGGIRSRLDAEACLRSGAEKVVLGSSAVENPMLISEISSSFGSQAVMVAVDMQTDVYGMVAINSGRTQTKVKVLDYIQQATQLGAGEILLQSVIRDGTMLGYDLESLEILSRETTIPIIISGGCSSNTDAIEAVKAGASGVAVGALFQFTENTPQTMARALSEAGIRVRKV